MNVEAEFINATAAAFTTANARMRLYQMIDFLNPDQPVYVDTDSMKYIYDPDNQTHNRPAAARAEPWRRPRAMV
jgi:hypothetical protein